MRKNPQNKNLANSLPNNRRGGQDGIRLIICGMNLNTREVAELRPDYLGFIFWEPSPRYFTNPLPEIDATIQRVGVFVNAPLPGVLHKINQHKLDAVQLHGNESPEYCKTLGEVLLEQESSENERQKVEFKIIKVFSIKDEFNFEVLAPYEGVCDFYLFDTKGKLPGGNGYSFNWNVLKNYPSSKPFFLSGGIGLEELNSVKRFLRNPGSGYCHAIDVNSKFETAPGLKDIEKLRKFKEALSGYQMGHTF
jgi:phosphoribosylanthranilate isomerase